MVDKRAYMREYMKFYRLKKHLEKFREIGCIRIKEYAKRTKNKFSKEWARGNKEKINAEGILNRAIAEGKIKRGSCRDCGIKKIHGHHFDHKKPLSVIWLCALHHKAEHMKIYV